MPLARRAEGQGVGKDHRNQKEEGGPQVLGDMMSHMASHRDEMLEFEQEMGTPLEGDDFELVAPSSSKAGVHLDDHFQNFHSRISRPTSLLPPSSARLLQRLQICWETASPDGFAPFPNRFTQTHSQKKLGQFLTLPFMGI